MEEQRYGGFWRRFFAFMIDKTIVYALSLNVSLIILLAVGIGNDVMSIIQAPPEKLSRGIGTFATLSVLISILIDMTYFTWFTGVSGQTPGKMLLHLRVSAVSGEPITPGTAFLRWTGCIVSGIALFLGFLWIPFDRKKQGWHDKIAMTVVVHVPMTPTKKKAAATQENPPDVGNVDSTSPEPVNAQSPRLHSSAPDVSVVPTASPEGNNEADTTSSDKNTSQTVPDEKGLDKPGEIL